MRCSFIKDLENPAPGAWLRLAVGHVGVSSVRQLALWLLLAGRVPLTCLLWAWSRDARAAMDPGLWGLRGWPRARPLQRSPSVKVNSAGQAAVTRESSPYMSEVGTALMATLGRKYQRRPRYVPQTVSYLKRVIQRPVCGPFKDDSPHPRQEETH